MSHFCKEFMLLIKWLGTILCLTGIALTSFNIYPLNIFLSLIGSFLWAVAGLLQRDPPLFLVEIVAVVIYILGVITWITNQ
jgi:drug/metabolite transporter (DMT)-like permease